MMHKEQTSTQKYF